MKTTISNTCLRSAERPPYRRPAVRFGAGKLIRRAAAILLPAILLAPAIGCGPSPPGRLNLPSGAVRCWTATVEILDLAFGDGGEIWAGSPGGLLRRDGDGRWSVLTVADGLPGNRVQALLTDSSGSLWIATDRGIARRDRGVLARYGEEAGLPSSMVNALAEGPDGTVYAGTEKGIAVFRDGLWEPFTDTHEFARRGVMDIARDGDGTMWFAKENALSHHLGGRRWEIFQKNILAPPENNNLFSNSLLCLAVDRSGVKWIGGKMGLNTFDGRQWGKYYYRERMTLGSGLRDFWIGTVAVSTDGNVWVAHRYNPEVGRTAGLARRAPGGEWRYFTSRDGLPSDLVHKLRIGPDGRVWAATGRGPAVIEGEKVTAVAVPQGLPGNHAITLLGRKGAAPLALLPEGPVAIEGDKPVALPPLPEGVKALSGVLIGDSVYLAGADSGLLVLEGGAWKEMEFFSRMKVRRTAALEDGTLLVITQEGVFRGRPGRWERMDLAGAPSGFKPLDAFPSPDGSLWLTGEMGAVSAGPRSAAVVIRRGAGEEVALPDIAWPYAGRNRVIFSPDGLPCLVSPAGLYLRGAGWEDMALPVPRGSVSAAHWEKSGRLWVGGRDGGLFYRENNAWREVLLGGVPAPSHVTSILRDDAGNLWLGTVSQGLFRLEIGKTAGGVIG